MKQNRRCLKIVVAGIVALTPVAVLALEPAMNVRGTITRIDSNTLEIKERDGTSEKVRLAENAKIAAVAKANLSDIQPGSFIGTAATPRTDGTLQAIEVHIFRNRCAGPAKATARGTLAQKAA